MTSAPRDRHPQPGDGWVECNCGNRHWGLAGAAGLLLVRRDAHAAVSHVVLQHRALFTHGGGTWALPGGARMPGESAVDGALREAQEEAGIDPADVRVLDEHVVDHGPWSYVTVLAEERTPVAPVPTDAESFAVTWVPIDDVVRHDLLPSFAAAWPDLRERLGRRSVL